MLNQSPSLLTRALTWEREIADALVIYSISILICGATFYSDLYVNFARAQLELGLERITVVAIFLGIASAVFGLRRITDQRKERLRRVAAEQHAASLSLRDPLTLLPNRRSLENELGTALKRAGSNLTVLVAGLKQFQTVNSVYGHASGDAVVSQVAARLRQEVERTAFIARIGDDEFAVLISGEEADRASSVALSLVEAIKQPLYIGMKECVVEAHIGIVQIASQRQEVGEVLRRAQMALDRARSLHADCCFFDPEMDAHIRERAVLEQEFRSAVGSDAMHLCYQPIIDLRSGRIVSFEALARWTHPERGLISPEVFIQLGENLNLIHHLSGKLFGDACRDAMAWPGHISLSFNFSPGQLRDPAFGEAVLSVLEETGFPPYRLEAEVTESALISDFAATRQVLHTLESAGIRIVMDDFGTGYSCLRHLRELRFNKIKIDRSFVNELRSNAECAAIVTAVAGLGRSLDVSTVAEGIETEDQLALVRAAGCTHGQGFLFGRPRPASELEFTPVGDRRQKKQAA
jgi:diguanylate cyclase (GGDEF)-like protein